ncbi:MAG: Tetratricopeptide repeat [Pseudomonadota bacterium]
MAALVALLTSCAIPRDNTKFSLSRPGAHGEQEVFASSKDLRVAGLVSEGLTFANKGRLFNAEGRFRQAYYLEPTNDRIAFNLAVIANQSGESDEALSILEGLLAKEPRNPHYLHALAEVRESQGQHEIAKRTLKEAFSIFKSANNAPRAAIMARSIANIAFGTGYEQEAICYSFEALSLSPTPQQVAAHARLLVGLNLFDQVIDFIQAHKPLAGEALTFHALGMAYFARGDLKSALEAEDNAVGRLTQAPELSQEINTAWWVMKINVPADAARTEATPEKIEELKEGAIHYAEREPYELVTWPAALRRELLKATSPAS